MEIEVYEHNISTYENKESGYEYVGECSCSSPDEFGVGEVSFYAHTEEDFDIMVWEHINGIY